MAMHRNLLLHLNARGAIEKNDGWRQLISQGLAVIDRSYFRKNSRTFPGNSLN